MDKYPGLDFVFSGGHPWGFRGYVQAGPFKIYMRVTKRAVDSAIVATVDVASIDSKGGTGKLGDVLDYIELGAKNTGRDGVYIENVLNPWLPDKLLEYGYKFVNAKESPVPNMYKEV